MFENVSTCDTCISPEKDNISSLVYHDSMIQVVISNPVTLSIIHFHPYLFFHLYADLFFANLLIITNRNCIPALSLPGNPNFSLLLPNPGNRSQCLVCSFVLSPLVYCNEICSLLFIAKRTNKALATITWIR
jgi:hypothetical protein